MVKLFIYQKPLSEIMNTTITKINDNAKTNNNEIKDKICDILEYF